MKVTIKTVADMAGVSKATVSRVINNSKPVSDEVKKNVMDAIEATSFKPSSVARSLSNQKTKLVGVIIPDVANPVFSEIIKGIEDQAHVDGYNILLCNSRNEVKKELEYLEILKDKEVDGIILSGFHNSDILNEYLESFGKPVILIGFELENMKYSSVIIDNVKAAKEVAEYFIDMGHKEIGMIHAPFDDICAGLKRYEGFVSVLEKNNLSTENMALGHFKIDDGYEGAKAILSNNPSVSAIFCANDIMAIGAMKYIIETGKKIPDDIEVIGFDDIYLSSIYSPSLTTISQPFEKKGQSAMKKLVEALHGNSKIERIVHKHTLIKRNSTR